MRDKLFVVTCVRIAYGTRFEKEESETNEIHGGFEGDATASGVPLSAGMGGKVSASSLKYGGGTDSVAVCVCVPLAAGQVSTFGVSQAV